MFSLSENVRPALNGSFGQPVSEGVCGVLEPFLNTELDMVVVPDGPWTVWVRFHHELLSSDGSGEVVNTVEVDVQLEVNTESLIDEMKSRLEILAIQVYEEELKWKEQSLLREAHVLAKELQARFGNTVQVQIGSIGEGYSVGAIAHRDGNLVHLRYR